MTIIGVLALELLHPGLLLAYIADRKRAGAANTQLFRRWYASQGVFENVLSALLIVILGMAVSWFDSRQRRAVICIFVVAAGCIFVSTQNFGAFSPSLVALVIILAQRLEATIHHAVAASVGGPTVAVACVFGVALAVMPFLTTQVAGVVYQAAIIKRSQGVSLGGV